MNRRHTLKALAACLVMAVATSCASFKTFVGIEPKRPVIKIENIDFVSINAKSLKLDLKLEVFNPNDFDLELSDIDTVSVDGKAIARGHEKKLVIAELRCTTMFTNRSFHN